MADDFETKRLWGREAEIAFSKWLQAHGWYILPAYDYSGLGENKPPRLEGPSNLIVPDLLAAKTARCCWLEIKRKTEVSPTFITGRDETGLSWRLWEHYLRVEQETGIDAWVVFVHDREDEVRTARVAYLASEPCAHGNKKMPILRESTSSRMGHMAFFCWDCLTRVAKTSEVLRQSAA